MSSHSWDPHSVSEMSDADFTSLLQRAQAGDSAAENELFEAIDGELRRMAAGLAHVCPDVRATSLVNDAYVYFFDRIKTKNNLDLKNRRYFFTAMANRMRNILLDRMKKRRPGPWTPALDAVLEDFRMATSWDFQQLYDALENFLQSSDPKQRRRHQLINLHFFGGMTYKAAAAELGISTTQYQLDRDRALAELQRAIDSSIE